MGYFGVKIVCFRVKSGSKVVHEQTGEQVNSFLGLAPEKKCIFIFGL
jgi:hypothetical protein